MFRVLFGSRARAGAGSSRDFSDVGLLLNWLGRVGSVLFLGTGDLHSGDGFPAEEGEGEVREGRGGEEEERREEGEGEGEGGSERVRPEDRRGRGRLIDDDDLMKRGLALVQQLASVDCHRSFRDCLFCEYV